LTNADDIDAPKVIVINRSLADRYWPDGGAVGARVRVWGATRTIAGIVGDLKDTPGDLRAKPGFYFPIAQQTQSDLIIAVRSQVDPVGMVSAIRATVFDLDKDLPLSDIKTLDQVSSAAVARTRFTMLLLSVFAGVALLLAAIGIYGVISYSLSQRTHELGIRVALGAQNSDIIAMVAREGMSLTLVGIFVGLASAIGLTRVMSSLVYGVGITDPVTFLSIGVVLAGVALGACLVPARRALKMDPAAALRHE
jgi:putative ABC transport system permease protein